MFDINSIINNAIAQAVDARITEIKQNHLNVVGNLSQRITDLEEANTVQAHLITKLDARIAALEVLALTPSTGTSDADVVESLNQKEWFWDKINQHIEAVVDRVQEDADTLDREKVEAIVRDFWNDEYENEVNEIAERKAEEAKEEAVEEMRDYLRDELDDKIGEALDNYDLDHKLSRILRDATISINI